VPRVAAEQGGDDARAEHEPERQRPLDEHPDAHRRVEEQRPREPGPAAGAAGLQETEPRDRREEDQPDVRRDGVGLDQEPGHGRKREHGEEAAGAGALGPFPRGREAPGRQPHDEEDQRPGEEVRDARDSVGHAEHGEGGGVRPVLERRLLEERGAV